MNDWVHHENSIVAKRHTHLACGTLRTVTNMSQMFQGAEVFNGIIRRLEYGRTRMRRGGCGCASRPRVWGTKRRVRADVSAEMESPVPDSYPHDESLPAVDVGDAEHSAVQVEETRPVDIYLGYRDGEGVVLRRRGAHLRPVLPQAGYARRVAGRVLCRRALVRHVARALPGTVSQSPISRRQANTVRIVLESTQIVGCQQISYCDISFKVFLPGLLTQDNYFYQIAMRLFEQQTFVVTAHTVMHQTSRMP